MGSFSCELIWICMDTWTFVGVCMVLTPWGRVTYICVTKSTNIGSNNGLSPGRRQAIIWTNDGMLLIWPLGTNFSEMLIGIHIFSFKKMHLKLSSGYRRPFCPGLNVLTRGRRVTYLVVDWIIISSDNGLSPVQHNNVVRLTCILLGTHFGTLSIKTPKSSLKQMHLNMSSVKCQPFFPSRIDLWLSTCIPQ